MCSYCGMTFNKKEHLQRHERTHTLDRPYHCDFPGCGKAFARRDTLTRHTRLHQRDDAQGSLKMSLANALGEDDESSEAFTTPAGSKQVSPATSGSTAPAPAPASAALLNVKGKKATHSRTGSIASQKSSRRGSGSKGHSSAPGSKKNTPEYRTPAEEAHATATPTAAIRNRPRRAAAAALYDENALMDEDTPSEPDEMQEDSGNDQDFMVMPAEVKPDIRQVSQPALAASIGPATNDMIKPLLPSLHTSSYLTRTLEAQHNQGIPHIKPSQATPIAATTLAGGHQPIYNFGSWDHANAIAAGQPDINRLNAQGNEGNPALLGYSSSANSSGSSSGSTYNSSHSQLGSGGSASLASPYSFNGSNPQATPGSALGLYLGLPPSPAVSIIPTPQEVQHFQGFNFPGTNNSINSNSNEGSAASDPQSQPYRIHGYASGQQQQQQQQQHGGFEGFPSFQGPNFSQSQQQQRYRSASSFSGAAAFPIPTTAPTAGPDGNAAVPTNGTTGSQGYSNQSPSTAAQSFLARGASGPYSPQLSQCNASAPLNLMSSSAPAGRQSAFTATGAFPNNIAGNNFSRKRAASFVPSFWAHMTIQHQDPTAGPMHSQENMYMHLHHRSATSNSFSSSTAEDFEVLSNHSTTSSPTSAPSMLSTSPTLTTSMNLYGMNSPASDISNLPSLSSSFSSAFSGDFLNSTNGGIIAPADVGAGVVGRTENASAEPRPFKHRNSFMEPLTSMDPANMAVSANPTEMNAAMLKAADAHTDQFINWPERDDASPFAFPGLSPENAFSAPSVMTSNSPSSASYLDLSDFDNTQTSLFGDKTFTIPLEIAQQTSGGRLESCGASSSAFGDGIDGIGRQSPVSSLEDWLLKQTSGNEYVF